MNAVAKATPYVAMATSVLLLIAQIYGFFMYRQYVPVGDDRLEPQVRWLLSPEKHVASGLNLVAFFMLIVTLVLLYFYFAKRLGRFGFIGFVMALLGNCLMYGDVWFEAFIAPMMAELAPMQTVGQFTPSLIIGALATFTLFGLGWLMFGFSLLLRKCMPWPLCALLMMAGLYGWQALTTPRLAPFALLLGVVGYDLHKRRSQP